MPFPYDAFPSNNEWKADSTVSGWSLSAYRIYDPTLGTIDDLVAHYNDPNFLDVQIETLFYLMLAIQFWERKLNAAPSNKMAYPHGNITAQGLPDTKKVTGSEDRRAAINALRLIVSMLLTEATNTNNGPAAMAALAPSYIKESHGNDLFDPTNPQSPTVDERMMQMWQNAEPGNLAVFIQAAHLQRRYKLRFRGGVAWRWDAAAAENAVYDTTDNSESEDPDQKTHFAMDTRGRIYAGFGGNTKTWFKHSSLLGGANVYCAGRIKIVNGKVTVVENDSGHYAPGIQQMRNILHRLRLYGCNTDAIQFQRKDPGPKATFTAAQIAASKAAWPDGVV